MSYIGNQPTSVAFLTDQFSGTGSQTAFTLSAAPANTASIIVAVSGVLQDPTTYSTSGLTLTFSAAPPVGTGNISVRFLGIPASNIATTAYRTQTEFTATAGQTTFSVPSYTPGFIDVYRNGVLLGSADFTATNGTTVVLASGATAGDLVETISFFVSSVLNAIPATAGAVTTPYLLDASVTQAKLAAGVGSNGPAFRATKSSSQTISNNTLTKVTFDTETFDTNNNFASSTFTPTVAGYYQVNFSYSAQSLTTGRAYAMSSYIYRSGSIYTTFEQNITSTADQWGGTYTALVYCNGTTDNIEAYFYQNNGSSGTVNLAGSSSTTQFSASLVRSA